MYIEAGLIYLTQTGAYQIVAVEKHFTIVLIRTKPSKVFSLNP